MFTQEEINVMIDLLKFAKYDLGHQLMPDKARDKKLKEFYDNLIKKFEEM